MKKQSFVFHYHLGMALLCIALIFAVVGCADNPDDSIKISLKDMRPVETNNQQSSPNTLRVAFSSITSPKETIIYYNDLIKYIEKHSGLTVKVIQRKTYEEVNNLIEEGEVDLAFICTYAYTLGNKEFGLQPFLVPQIDGKVTYQSFIIVPYESEINSFTDLKGRRFAFTDPLSNTGYIYPNYLIHKQNDDPENFFRKTIFTYSHDNSVKAVTDKIVDGAAVDSLVFNYLVEQKPEIKSKVRIIKKSEEFGIPPIVLSPAVSAETKEKIKNIFLNMHLTHEGKTILQHLKIERFLEQDDDNYDSIREIIKEVLNEK